MLFNSADFLVFFPVAVCMYYIVPDKLRYIWLLLCSYYFYLCSDAALAITILLSTLTTYFCALTLKRIGASHGAERKKAGYMKACIILTAGINLGLLGYFKYYNFFIENINAALGKAGIQLVIPEASLLLPIGISFYTFQVLGYIIDVYRGELEPERNILKYSLMVSFFPKLISGPIESSKKMLEQISERHYWDFERVRDGFMLMLWGYFLKLVIADRATIFVDAVYGNIGAYGGWYMIVASIMYSIQIFCDFAGYSTIALGAAKILGFELTDNFNCPYFSRRCSEFWQRWHISLFAWFKKYIYIPLGGSRKGRVRKYINIMVVFFTSGLWHGASWSFIIWGCLNGLFQIAGDCLKPVRDKAVSILHLDREAFSHKLFQTVFTFSLINAAWVFFRAGSAGKAFACLKSMAGAANIWVLFDGSLLTLGLDQKNFTIFIFAVLLLLFVDHLKYRGIAVRQLIARQELWFRWAVAILGIAAIMTFGVWGSGYNAANFLYFKF